MRLTARELTVAYGTHEALRDVSLQIEAGETIAILGGSGAGKSTLTLALKGIAPLRSGSIEYAAYPSGTPVSERVSLVLQRPEAALFAETVWAEIAFAPHALGLRGHALEQRVAWALAALGLPEQIATRDPLRLSGGEQRRVSIAAALAMRPEVLLLDEPTAGIDADSRRALAAAVANLSDTGTSVVMSTHDVEFAARTCGRIVLLQAGVVAADQSVGVAFSPTGAVRAHGFEPPALMQAAEAVAERLGKPAPALWDEHLLLNWLAETAGGR